MSGYRFTIDAFGIDTIPMARLAEYMIGLARLLGEQEQVRFDGVRPGSVVVVARVEAPASEKVARRLEQVRDGRAPREAVEAFRVLDNLLAKDNAVGALISPEGAPLMAFPGRTRPKPIQYGPFRERGSLDGVVIRIGGRDETVPVLLCNGDVSYPCQASVEVSKRLARHYRGETVRVHGSGKWVREEDRTWTLQRFDIEDFELLDDATLTETIGRLHAVEGGLWEDAALGDLFGLRGDRGDRH